MGNNYNIITKGEVGINMGATNDIKDVIKNRRKELGLTMKEVAEAVGVSEATVSRWESGDIGDMKRSRIAALAKVLRISPNVIMGWKDEEDFKLGNLLLMQDDDLIEVIKTLTNLPQEQLTNLTAIVKDILAMNDKQIDQLKKFIKVVQSNILD